MTDDLTRPNTEAELRALFRSLSVADLRLFAAALRLDAPRVTEPGFVETRLRIIDEILRERGDRDH